MTAFQTRAVILRAVEQVWPHEPRSANVEHLRSFFPGTPERGRQGGRLRAALRALSSNGRTGSGVVGLHEQKRTRAHGYEPERAKTAQRPGLAQHGYCDDHEQGVASKVASPATRPFPSRSPAPSAGC
jgi:hypothetical protein